MLMVQVLVTLPSHSRRAFPWFHQIQGSSDLFYSSLCPWKLLQSARKLARTSMFYVSIWNAGKERTIFPMPCSVARLLSSLNLSSLREVLSGGHPQQLTSFHQLGELFRERAIGNEKQWTFPAIMKGKGWYPESGDQRARLQTGQAEASWAIMDWREGLSGPLRWDGGITGDSDIPF